jgi:hypothetical protein
VVIWLNDLIGDIVQKERGTVCSLQGNCKDYMYVKCFIRHHRLGDASIVKRKVPQVQGDKDLVLTPTTHLCKSGKGSSLHHHPHLLSETISLELEQKKRV